MDTTTPATPIGGLSPDAFSSMFEAISGLRNRRALLAIVGCMFVGVLAFGLFAFLAARAGFLMGLLGALSLFIASATGVNAAGVLLMEQAKGLPSRRLSDALVYGLLCIPRFILLGLALFAVSLVVFIGLALVYFVCKIPVLGTMLLVVVFPLSVVISGLTLCGLFLCMALALPAIWEGASITRAIAQAFAIARSRLVEAMLLLAVVWVLSLVVAFIVFGVLFTGLMPMLGMSASILGGDGLGSMLGMLRHRGDFGDAGGGFGGGAGQLMAQGIGGGLLWALAGSLLSLVNLMGLNLVYLRVTEGLDSGAAEAALKARLDDAKRQAANLGQKAKDAAERAREQARSSATAAQTSAAAASTTSAATATATAPVPAAPAFSPAPAAQTLTPRDAPDDSTLPATAKALACPQCLSAVARDDAFCGVCGHKLR